MKNYIINLSITLCTTIIIIFIYHTVYIDNIITVHDKGVQSEQTFNKLEGIKEDPIKDRVDNTTESLNQNHTSVIEYIDYPEDYNDDLIRIEDVEN